LDRWVRDPTSNPPARGFPNYPPQPLVDCLPSKPAGEFSPAPLEFPPSPASCSFPAPIVLKGSSPFAKYFFVPLSPGSLLVFPSRQVSDFTLSFLKVGISSGHPVLHPANFSPFCCPFRNRLPTFMKVGVPTLDPPAPPLWFSLVYRLKAK